MDGYKKKNPEENTKTSGLLQLKQLIKQMNVEQS